jgi:antitoxin ParD1/3/4
MDKSHTVNVSLTKHLAGFVKKKVKSGRYGSASEVVREALRNMEQHEAAVERLRKDIQVGLDQIERGETVDGEEAIARILNRRKKRKAG